MTRRYGLIVIALMILACDGKAGRAGDSAARSSSPPAGMVHGVTMTPLSVTLGAGSAIRVFASVDADAAVVYRGVTNWTSGDPAVAAVDEGVVTARKAGTATITASAWADTTVKGTIVVTVK
ncbi:MAG TPA: hypothetical protein VK636_02980 [Gemmatimonadaceae bacterium]|nr:hypothetical protein [Gemmatimonadaceae bacterium]